MASIKTDSAIFIKPTIKKLRAFASIDEHSNAVRSLLDICEKAYPKTGPLSLAIDYPTASREDSRIDASYGSIHG